MITDISPSAAENEAKLEGPKTAVPLVATLFQNLVHMDFDAKGGKCEMIFLRCAYRGHTQ